MGDKSAHRTKKVAFDRLSSLHLIVLARFRVGYELARTSRLYCSHVVYRTCAINKICRRRGRLFFTRDTRFFGSDRSSGGRFVENPDRLSCRSRRHFGFRFAASPILRAQTAQRRSREKHSSDVTKTASSREGGDGVEELGIARN